MSGMEPAKVIVHQRSGLEQAELKAGGRDVSWEDALATTRLHDCVPVEANEAMYILYTSGTTGNLPWPTSSHSWLLDLVQLRWHFSSLPAGLLASHLTECQFRSLFPPSLSVGLAPDCDLNSYKQVDPKNKPICLEFSRFFCSTDR